MASPSAATTSRARTIGWWLGVAALLTLVGVVIPVVLAHHYGALDIPRSDDWSYLRTLFTLDDHGRWDFNNWVSMTLVGQVLLTLPLVAVFGHSITAISIYWAIIGVGGLLATVWLGRELELPPWWSALVALVIAACPLWGVLAPTYMTDVPAFAFEMLSMALACAAFRRRPISMPMFVASIVVGLLAVSIRQYAVVPLLAILLAAFWWYRANGDAKRQRQVVGIAIASGAAVLALVVWWSGVPRARSFAPRVPNPYTVQLAFQGAGGFLRLAGIMLLPVVLLARPGEIVRRAWRVDEALSKLVLVVVGATLLLSYALDPEIPFVGNYFDRRGVLADDIINGTRPDLMPAILWFALVILGSACALVFALAVVPFLHDAIPMIRERRFGSPDPRVAALGLSVLGFAVAYEIAIATRLPIFDRYALPALPLVGVLLLRSVRYRREVQPVEAAAPSARSVTTWSAVALVALGGLGIVYTAESASYDGTRWKVAELATQQGYAIDDVDNGYEWVGWFVGRAPLRADTVAERKKLRREYLEGFCVTVVINPPKGGKNVLVTLPSSGLLRKSVPVVALRNKRDCASGADPTPTVNGAGSSTRP
jgi:4-amino-4-deoxy-L-arabinose transferase-like glycosyltransferase